jgi:two-component system nitrate/nitrite response regulator NarL
MQSDLQPNLSVETPRAFPSTVVLADREPMYLAGLHQAVAWDARFEVVEQTYSGRDLLEVVGRIRPRLVLAGLTLSCGRSFPGLAWEVRHVSPMTRLVVLIPPSAKPLAKPLLDAGVNAVVSRCVVAETLISAVESALNGQPAGDFIPSEPGPRKDSTVAHIDESSLSRREVEVFRLLGARKSCREIAAILGLSLKTVEAHRENIKAKLGIRKSSTLVQLASAKLLWEDTGMDYVI